MTSTFWDKQAQHFDDHINYPRHAETIEHIKPMLSVSDMVLDFGCASGETSVDIAPYVQKVHGIDLSAKMIELATQKAHKRQLKNVSFDQMNIFDQRLASSSYSVVIAFNIFHLLTDVPNTLARLNDLLSPGGLLISQTPCLGEKRLLFNLFLNPAQKLGLVPAIRSFTTAELELFLSNSSFEIIETERWDKETAVQWIVARKM
jgi:2-polyprenyl-3-methyl-5-hydroxy-6-metoxy-1,4-benzoquinol methylase